MSLDCVVSVKDEPDWEVAADDCGVSEAASREGLYAGHEVKGELVLGPEVLQPPDVQPRGAEAVYELRDGQVSVKFEIVELSPLNSAPPGFTEPAWWWSVSARAREQLAMTCSVRLERLRDDKAPLACPTCLHTFHHEASLATHMRVHAGETCGKQLKRKRKSDFNKKKHVTKTYYCKSCSQYFSCKNLFDEHKSIHTADKLFTCDTCNTQFTQRSYLLSHIKNINRRSCEICDKTFCNYRTFTEHKRMHTSGKPFKCEICDAHFARKHHLLRHIDAHTGRKPFTCKVCSKAFATKYSLAQHNLIHEKPYRKPFSCDVCNKRFKYKGNLVPHKKIHTGEKAFSCEYCHMRFIGSNDLTRHKRTHMTQKVQKLQLKIYTCDECKRQFTRKEVLKKHFIRKHTERTPYSCDICYEKFSRKSHATKHKRRIHKPFACELCKKQFSTKGGLITHSKNARLHTQLDETLKFGHTERGTDAAQMAHGPTLIGIHGTL